MLAYTNANTHLLYFRFLDSWFNSNNCQQPSAQLRLVVVIVISYSSNAASQLMRVPALFRREPGRSQHRCDFPRTALRAQHCTKPQSSTGWLIFFAGFSDREPPPLFSNGTVLVFFYELISQGCDKGNALFSRVRLRSY